MSAGGRLLHGTVSADQTKTGWGPVFAILRYRNYRLFWVGTLSMVFAQTMEHVVLAWLIYQLTGSAISMGLTGIAHTAPQLVLSFLGGAIADRVDRRRLLVCTQGSTGLAYFGLAILVVTGLVQVWHVVVFSFFLGCIRSFDQPSRNALLPHMVPREEMARAVAMGGLAWQGPRPIGPAVAGMLMAFVGVGETLYVASACFLLSTFMFGSLRLEKPAFRSSEQGLLGTIVEGLDVIRRNEIFYGLIGMTFFNSVFGMSYVLLLPVFAKQVLDVGPDGYGFLSTAAGVGAVSGILLAGYLAGNKRKGLQTLVASVVFGVMLIAFAFSNSYLLSIVLLAGSGVANQLYMTTNSQLIQMEVADEYRGRIMGVWGLTWSLVPIGGTVSGAITEYFGPQVAVSLGGLMVISLAVAILVGMPRLRRL